MNKIFDISWPVAANVAGWPGDTRYSLNWTMRQSQGESVNVSRLTMSPHTGTHADAPFHFDQDRATIDQLPLEVFVGPARLVDVRGRSPIRVRNLGSFDWTETPRLLLRTGGWIDPARFPDSIPILDAEVPVFLCEQRITLVGVDVPSVDVLDSKRLPIHHALGHFGIHILEGLDLREPPPGVYELVALPLKIVGGDGSPVRAVLRETAG